MQDILLYLIGFGIFVFLQALFINGVYELMRGKCVNDLNTGLKCDGNLGYKIFGKWIEKSKDKWYSNPIYSCVKCMASLWGAITFFPTVIYLFGFHWIEIPIWAFNSIILITVNYWIFKKI